MPHGEDGCLWAFTKGIGRTLVMMFIGTVMLVMTWKDTWAMLPWWGLVGILLLGARPGSEYLMSYQCEGCGQHKKRLRRRRHTARR